MRKILISGASRGIGKAIAIRMAQYGAKVMVSSRKIDSCNKVVEEIKSMGGEAIAHECNIGHKEALQGLADSAYKNFGKVDILVLNAASNPYYGPLANITDEAFEKVMHNNVKSNLCCCCSSAFFVTSSFLASTKSLKVTVKYSDQIGDCEN